MNITFSSGSKCFNGHTWTYSGTVDLKNKPCDCGQVLYKEQPLYTEEQETYTLEQMKKAFEYGKSLEQFNCFEDFIISLKQPKKD